MFSSSGTLLPNLRPENLPVDPTESSVSRLSESLYTRPPALTMVTLPPSPGCATGRMQLYMSCFLLFVVSQIKIFTFLVIRKTCIKRLLGSARSFVFLLFFTGTRLSAAAARPASKCIPELRS